MSLPTPKNILEVVFNPTYCHLQIVAKTLFMMPKVTQPCINPYDDPSHLKKRAQKGLRMIQDDTIVNGRLAVSNFNWSNVSRENFICAKCRLKLTRDADRIRTLANVQNALAVYNQQVQANVARDSPQPSSSYAPSAPPLPVEVNPAQDNIETAGISNIPGSSSNNSNGAAENQPAALYPALPEPTTSGIAQPEPTNPNPSSPNVSSNSSRTSNTMTVTTPGSRALSDSTSTSEQSSVVFHAKKRAADLNKSLEMIGASPVVPSDSRKRARISRKFLQFQQFATKALNKFSKLAPGSIQKSKQNCRYCNTLLNELSGKFHEQNSRTEKYKVLTCIPKRFTVRKIMNVTGCTHYESKLASKLKGKEGAFSWPEYHYGRPLAVEVRDKIIQFYLSDVNSRPSPNSRDVIKVRQEDGSTVLAAKRRILDNLNDLYSRFKEENPDIKVGIAKFAALRPKQCTWPGLTRQHNVCVCEIHQNFIFLLQAVDYKGTVKDFVDNLVCGQQECYLGLCINCPNVNKIEEVLQNCQAEGDVTFAQWTHTDSIEIRKLILSAEDFKKTFIDYVPKILEHEYVYREQSKYIRKIKTDFFKNEGAISIQVDFAQNYSCVAQNSTQVILIPPYQLLVVSCFN